MWRKSLVGLACFGLLLSLSVTGQEKKKDDKKEEKKKEEKKVVLPERYIRVVDDGSKTGNTTIVVAGWRIQPLKSKIIGAELTTQSEVKDGLTTVRFNGRKLRLEFSLPPGFQSIQYWGEGTTLKRVVLAVPEGAAINPPGSVPDPKK